MVVFRRRWISMLLTDSRRLEEKRTVRRARTTAFGISGPIADEIKDQHTVGTMSQWRVNYHLIVKLACSISGGSQRYVESKRSVERLWSVPLQNVQLIRHSEAPFRKPLDR
ncbi:hypothetical protein CSKR_108215 [Clonorchis sinensis]|uniref:Uncharacterized protein n=1 Tax=Clonorchis sinensis TaxID=79923 RepID=A0A419PRN7_CLOSI|nr:hypothetical protein CSKR_108215 [Clonorchis sinensis]